MKNMKSWMLAAILLCGTACVTGNTNADKEAKGTTAVAEPAKGVDVIMDAINLLEAMSYQLPLVVTDIPATHLIELPEDNYVEVANSDALAEGIKNALSKDFELKHYDLSNYNWDSIAKQTLDVYKEVLK